MTLLPGQTLTNGVSNYIFGTNLTNFSTTYSNQSVYQQQIKNVGITNYRIAVPPGLTTTSSINAYLDQVATACAAANIAMLVVLHSNDIVANSNVVSHLGSRCNMYELGNEPDINSISTSQYLGYWNAQIPTLRGLNPGAAFIGPVLGVFNNVNSYLVPWLQGCHTSGNLPDAISYHIYPCSGGQNQAACQPLSTHIASSVPQMNTVVSGILGHTLPLAITEWNIDANNPRQAYTTDATFVQPWVTSALDSMAASGLAMANLFFDADLVHNTSPFASNIMFAPMQASVTKYLSAAPSSASLSVSASSLSFSATTTTNPPSQSVVLTGGTNAQSWSLSGSTSWLIPSISSGTLGASRGTQTVTFSVNVTGLTAGTHTTTITFVSGALSATTSITLVVTAPGGAGTIPLTVLFAAAASSTIGTANKLYTIPSSTTPSSIQTYTLLGTSTGFGEITSQGTGIAWLGAGSIGTPTGKGFFLDATTLDGQSMVAGSYSAVVRLASGTGTGGTLGGSFTANLFCRVYRYRSGTYTSILSMSLSGQTVNSTIANYTFSGSTGSSTSFLTNDRLYIDIWAQVLTNTNGATEYIRFNRLSTDTVGLTGDILGEVVTPGYQFNSSTTLVDKDLHGRFRMQATRLRNIFGRVTISNFHLGTTSFAARLRLIPQTAQDLAARFTLFTPSEFLITPLVTPVGLYQGTGGVMPIVPPTTPYVVNGFALDTPTICTGPMGNNTLLVPPGSVFTLTFNNPSLLTQNLLTSNQIVSMTFALASGEMVSGLVSLSVIPGSPIWQVTCTVVTAIAVQRWRVQSQFP